MNNPFQPPESSDQQPPIEPPDFTPNNEDRNLALIAHLSGCAGILAGGLIGFIGPLIIYLTQKDKSPFAESQAKEALNFQITLLILSVVCGVLLVASCGALFPIVFVPMVLQIVFGIIAALAVRDGRPYQYPFNLRLFQ
ncbi:DUF4870 domain-containing protein [Novipirellula sp.]|uniref:DUF4870 domain-containing protein n=1 Tax=Novipirellula sp. TaxID=2795430 RepID=UPI0035642375